MKSLNIGKITIENIVETIGLHKPDFLFPDLKKYQLEEQFNWLIPNFIDSETKNLIMVFQSYVIKTKNTIILVDTCVGNDKSRINRPFWHKQKTPYLEKLNDLGLNPGDIDYVMCTHLHADHVGWNTKLENNQWVPTFPNAKYIFSKKEYEFWSNEININKEINHGSFQDSVLPVIENGKYELVSSNFAIEDYLYFEAAPGHTPGNLIINLFSENNRAVLCGDTIHHAVQLSYPEISSRFCEDPFESSITRKKLLNNICNTGTIILPAHFPKVGTIETNKKGFYLNY
ncbi:MAG: hypothetical protein CFH01_01427 [Alphaproteobacteria bacterium MarineAlpha2_Bin1]|nr:MAG: hypothetical protein CFH01_01427 [Alphaproteobacteria bacterium MarineAlpha2_Bin1]